MSIKLKSANQGFTLVELLIVIVVIAILAAITIVAYGNVTNKAHDSAYKSDAGSVVSLIESFNADTGAYPSATANVNATGQLTWSGGTLTAKQPADIEIYNSPSKPTANSTVTSCSLPSANTVASAAPGWNTCLLSTANVYPVVFSSGGACVYYYQSAPSPNASPWSYATAGQPSSAC